MGKERKGKESVDRSHRFNKFTNSAALSQCMGFPSPSFVEMVQASCPITHAQRLSPKPSRGQAEAKQFNDLVYE